jgi:hypothetical protein
MYNTDTELLFPSRVIASLRSLKGETWRSLIDEITKKDPNRVEYMAFVLMMVRMGGCVSCNADSFRAMRGCPQCARQTIKRFRGPDSELVEMYKQALSEVTAYMEKNA